MSYTYNYPMPSITGDVIVWDRQADKYLLIRRGGEPFKGSWAIVGGFFNPEGKDMDQSIRAAAIRELKEELGIDFVEKPRNPDTKVPVSDVSPFTFSFLTVQDKPGRDPRGRVVTLVYVLTIWDGANIKYKAADDAAEAQWFSREDILSGKVPMAFDHLDSIRKHAFGILYI